MNVEAHSPTDLMSQDLAKSGLTYQDMMTRVLDEASRTAVNATSNIKGYVIPYFNMYGRLTQYYRVKITDDGMGDVKYLQLKNTPNHVYFPKDWLKTFEKANGRFCVLIEGEKKAALANRMGIPAVAFSGVDSWRNRTIIVPKASETFSAGKSLGIKLPISNFDESTLSPLALGLQELIDLGLKYKSTFVIIYDSDSAHGVATGPQRAAARLGYELRYKGFGLAQIRQLVPPHFYANKEGKTTLEDILLSSENGGLEGFMKLLNENFAKRVAFPTHPSVREHIAKQLQAKQLDRKQLQNVSLALLTELDARGTRMFSPDDLQMYYFDATNNHLMKVDINKINLVQGQEGEFGMLLYRDYSISMAADSRLIQWLGAQYAGEQPVEQVSPFRVVAKPKPNEDAVRFQINNGQYIKVTPSLTAPYTIMANGSDGTLFESQNNYIDGIDQKLLTAELQRQHVAPLKNWWQEVIKSVRLKHPGRAGDIISYLYYISPYLLRWRGMQLPVEIITGEAGSGKSTLCEIRLNILTGDPKLRNTPNDQKDWYAAIANSGGLHITDNVQLTDKNLRQRISDELCRIVTEPDPRIQMRKYFTEADERSIRVNAVFGFTAISMPFQNGDLLQRAVTLELTKDIPLDLNSNEGLTFDGHWKDKQLQKFGGRTSWVAHQMVVLHKFFRLVQQEWNPNYKAKHRLVGLEQSLMLIAKVFGQDGSWIPDYLAQATQSAISSSDWAIQGLQEWADHTRQRELVSASKVKWAQPIEFTAGEIADWVSGKEDYEDCYQLKNARALGRYMQSNKFNIAQITGIIEHGQRANRILYRLADSKLKNNPIPPHYKKPS